ncbi:MAG: hypothetical protein ABSG67_05680 [Thermoguttaceae bacterium]
MALVVSGDTASMETIEDLCPWLQDDTSTPSDNVTHARLQPTPEVQHD